MPLRIASSIDKSKFILFAINIYKREGTIPVDEIFSYINQHKDLVKVASEFNATREDISSIMGGMLTSGTAGFHKGHFSPISGVLFADTLAFLLRGQRGQIPEINTYIEVEEYFRTGSLFFKPEIASRHHHRSSVHEERGAMIAIGLLRIARFIPIALIVLAGILFIHFFG